MYEAYDTVTDTNVVLRETAGVAGKVATATQLDAINATFVGEAKVLAAIRHESLVSVQDYFSDIDRQYLVLELVTGDSLAKYLDPGETKPALADVLSWADQVLGALQCLHSLSTPVIHGDVRPENMKLTSSARVKLLTTKISAGSRTAPAQPSGGAADQTVFNYRPLEQIWPDISFRMQKVILEGFDEKAAGVLLRPLDARTDIYSAGASFYHLLTGTLPVDALERSTAILDGKADPLARPTDLDPSIPPEISDALMRAMSIRRENRFDWAVIMSQVLRTAVIRAKERESGLTQPTPDVPNIIKEVPVEQISLPSEREPDFDPNSPAAQFELRQQLVADRQKELEAEQARLEEEHKKIEQRRQELETEKEQHAAERERLRIEVEEARQRAETERKRLEKERLEQEAEKERKKIADRLAALAVEREQALAEEERLEKEAEAERRRAEQRLSELLADQERHRAMKERLALEAKRELELAEKRLLELSGADLDITEPEPVDQNGPRAVGAKDLAKEVTFAPTFEYETTHAGRSGVNWRIPVAGVVGLLVVGGAVGWMFMPSRGEAPAAMQPTGAFKPETKLSVPDLPPSPEPEQIAPQRETATAAPDDPAGTAPAGDAQRRPQVGAVQEKQKRAATEKPPAAKKKVTVDDLINDN